jgi:hypothetical protein
VSASISLPSFFSSSSLLLKAHNSLNIVSYVRRAPKRIYICTMYDYRYIGLHAPNFYVCATIGASSSEGRRTCIHTDCDTCHQSRALQKNRRNPACVGTLARRSLPSLAGCSPFFPRAGDAGTSKEVDGTCPSVPSPESRLSELAQEEDGLRSCFFKTVLVCVLIIIIIILEQTDLAGAGAASLLVPHVRSPCSELCRSVFPEDKLPGRRKCLKKDVNLYPEFCTGPVFLHHHVLSKTVF